MTDSLVKRVVVLDRDGTLVDFHRDPELGVVTPAFHPDHVRFLPGVVEALSSLVAAGWSLAIATNQPGAAKGELPKSAILSVMDAIEHRLKREGIRIEAIEMCLHHPTGGDRGDASLVRACDCRKPAPGMVRAILGRLDVDPSNAWMVGDTLTDVAAGTAAGVRTALLSPTRRCELCPMKDAAVQTAARPTFMAPTLAEIADVILGRTDCGKSRT